MTVHNVMAQRRPDPLERLYLPFPVDSRGDMPEGKTQFYEAPVFNAYAGYVSVLCSGIHGITVTIQLDAKTSRMTGASGASRQTPSTNSRRRSGP
jgi:hypothetical protein